jgi:hypothetical protein
MTVKSPSPLRFCFTQVKATVLKVKPHALMTSRASGSSGLIHQRNRAQSSAANRSTGSALMAASPCVS